MTRDEAISIGADKTFTLDLNGYSIMVDEPIRVSGNLTIQDRTTAGEPVVSSDYGSVSYDAGSIEYTGSNTAIIVQEGGSVTLKSGIVDASAAGTGIYVNGNRNPEGSENIQPVNSSATIEGGYVHSMEYGLGAAGRGGNLTVSGGVIAAEGNTAIGGNGTNSASRYDGGTEIVISGGTMIGRMAQNFVEDGYMACGIYHPQRGTLTITGGTVYADTGVGIAMRGGTLDMTGGTVIATGHTSGNVGDSKVTLDCYGIQVDDASQYYDYANCKVTISGDACVSADAGVECVKVTPADDEDKIQITGGYFTSNPGEYVAKDYYAVESDKPGYAYMVTSEKPEEAVTVVTETVDTEVEIQDSDTKEKVEAVMDNAAVEGVADAISSGGKNNIIAAGNIGTVDSDDVVEVEISVSVTATSASLTEGSATVTYEVTPVATVKVNREKKASEISVPNSYLNGQTFTVRLPLPTGLEDPAEVMHIADNGSRERFTGSAFTIGSGWVEVEISHFSQLIVNETPTVAAKIGNVAYGTLQEAIDAASSGATIVLNQNCDEAVTVNGKSVTIDCGNYTYDPSKVSVGSRCSKQVSGTSGTNQVITITYDAPSHDSDGGSTVTRYAVTVEDVRNGEVSVSPTRAAYNQTVTITVTPDEGYELSELVVTDRDGDEVTLRSRGDGHYTFTMPRSAVTVEAAFARESSVLSFRDVDVDDWYYNAVVYAVENGIMGGYNTTTFGPEDDLPRSQMVQVLYNLSGQPDLTGLNLGYPFADVEGGQWYANAVYWARLSGIAGGYNDNTFRPDRPVTRQEAAVMMRSYALLMGCDVSYDGQPVLAFADSGEVDSWAWDAMSWAVDAGVMGGKGGGYLDPTGTATRAEIAQMLMSLCENVLNG